MRDVLTPLPPRAVESVWCSVLEARLREEVHRSQSGQCLRIDGIPRSLLEQLADRLHNDASFPAEVCLVDQQAGPEPWRVGVHKVVERRNAESGVLIALLPPEVRLAAGDSIDVSTFRSVATDALALDVESALFASMSSDLAPLARGVLEDLVARGGRLSTSSRLAFLATISSQPRQEPRVVGGSLFALGLVPDFSLWDDPAQLHFRIGQRNLKLVVDPLRDPGRTPLERVMRLPLSDEVFRSRLMELFGLVAPDRIEDWGARVATDPVWRPLALEHWPFETMTAPGSVDIELEPLKLPARDDGILVYDPREKLRVAWRTTPPSHDVPGLSHFRLEIVRSDRVVAWESPLIKLTKAVRRSKELKDLDLDPDVYFVRVVGLTDTGDPFSDQAPRDPDDPGGKRTNESDDFIVSDASDPIDEDLTPITVTTVASFAEAELLARWAIVMGRKDLARVATPDRDWLVPIDATVEVASASVRFESQRQFTVRFSQRLRRLETEILLHPEVDGTGHIQLGRQETASLTAAGHVPSSFAAARRAVFDAILSTPVDQGSAVVALADLCGIADAIEAYAAEYRAWVDSGDMAAVSLDIVRANVPNVGTFALLAPTHPLRLLWLLQEQELERAWTALAAGRSSVPGDLVGTWRRALSATGLPPLAVLAADEYYVDAGPLPGGWGAYVSPRQTDSRSAAAILRRRLGTGAAHSVEADIAPRVLADRLHTFVQQHAYTPTLVLNVINPGDGALLVDALEDLEYRLGPDSTLRYDVRLFSESDEPGGVGQALRDLMEPERQLSEAAARLAGPGLSFLFPKLSWSRKPLAAFVARPGDFGAHITLILDHFRTKLAVAAVDADDRSSFVHGLVQESPQRFVGRGSMFRWIRRPAPVPCPELPTADGRSARIAELLGGIARSQAGLLTAGRANGDGFFAVTELDLDPAAQSLLYSAHAVSTWVLTLDANLGIDYFDARGRLERPGYLLDFTPEFLPSSGRQLLLTTRADEELVRLVAPLLDQLDLDGDGPGARLIIESLRALSGRLALRVTSSPNQRQGALGMALAKLFLESFGLLHESIVIPLDAHPELSKKSSAGASQDLRSDLLVVSADPERGHLDFLVIEAKCLVGAGLATELRERIDAQTSSSVAGLRDAFEVTEPQDRIDRHVQTWKLTTVLTFYLDRAVRYGLVDPQAAVLLRRFFQRLDHGYGLAFRRIGLVFRHESPTSYCERSDPDLPIWVVGRDVIDGILTEGLEWFVTTPTPADERGEIVAEPPLPAAPRHRTMASHPTWSAVRRDFSGPSPTRSPTAPGESKLVAVTEPPEPTAFLSADDQSSRGNLDVEQPESVVARETTTAPAPAEASRSDQWGELGEEALVEATGPEAPGPDVDVLIGDNHVTQQYGVLGVVAPEPFRRVGLDLNGCNTISVFGVQGGGKSYTLGSILEMAVLPIAGINLLPRQLGAVVFHYHQTQDYPPEFVSMASPNDEPSELAALRGYGATPAPVDDLIVLTTADMVDRRRAEFPGVQVEPIKFRSGELTVADWRFLMGATGNDSLYLKLLNRVMQQARHDLTLDSIQQGLAAAQMSDSQRSLATTRLDLAARFVDDSRSLRSLLHAGRVIVVDLRDEFIEREEALGLFVTMLNVFAGAGMGEDPFNKIIVFDEAHKYMGGSLIGQVVEVIREMRHKGVSVVIASQDPVNVPPAVVELSSAVVLHRFNSPNWLKHIQRSLAALGDLTPAMLSSLGTGEAFVWANRSSDPVFTRRAVKLRMRPRVTKHGGSTRKALD
jgi:DNA phosphorothioation-dependent restriction protein DptH